MPPDLVTNGNVYANLSTLWNSCVAQAAESGLRALDLYRLFMLCALPTGAEAEQPTVGN